MGRTGLGETGLGGADGRENGQGLAGFWGAGGRMTGTGWQVCRPHPLEGWKRGSPRTGKMARASPSNEECFSWGGGHCSRVLGWEEASGVARVPFAFPERASEARLHKEASRLL